MTAEEGISFNMDIALRANTILAHRALQWALEMHGEQGQARLKEELLADYFTNGRDIGDPDVVADAARRAGMGHADADGHDLRAWLDSDAGKDLVGADIDAAADREITAVPSFVIDVRILIPGAQDVEVFVSGMERVLTA